MITASVLCPSLLWVVVRPVPIGRVGTAAAAVPVVAAALSGSAGSTPALLGSVCCLAWVVLAAVSEPSLRATRRVRSFLTVGLVADVVAVVAGSRLVGRASPGLAVAATVVVVAASGVVAVGLVARAGASARSAGSAGRPDDE